MINWFKVVGLLIVPALFYTAASFLHLRYPRWALWVAILISIGFASFEYVFRIPAIKEIHNNMGVSDFQIQIVWVVITLSLAYSMRWISPLPKQG